MKRIIYKILVITFPVILISVYFLVDDPMRIIYSYNSPVEKGVLINDRVFQFRYLEKNKFHYSSFIFGSSRSKAFKTKAWSDISGVDSCFHLGVNDETVFGIKKKLDYVSENSTIKNVLFIFDHRLLSLDRDHDAHIFREDPHVSGEASVQFYKRFVMAFLKPKFLMSYFKWKRSGVYDKTMGNFIFAEDFSYINSTGDIHYSGYDKEIERDSSAYYARHKDHFYVRSPSVSDPVLTDEGKKLIKEISQTLKKKKISYRIIITPNYDQKKLHTKDLEFLKEVFGKDLVYDFSGVNEITSEVGNYYEEKHFKPYIANKLIRSVYGKQ